MEARYSPKEVQHKGPSVLHLRLMRGVAVADAGAELNRGYKHTMYHIICLLVPSYHALYSDGLCLFCVLQCDLFSVHCGVKDHTTQKLLNNVHTHP